MSPFTLILSLAILALYFAIRGHWMIHQAARYGWLASYYCIMTKQGIVVRDEMSMVWSSPSILFDLPWCWRWERYMVHLDHYAGMNEWIAQQLERTDLTWATFVRETNLAVGLNAEGTELAKDTGVETPVAPSDPERN